MKPTLDDVWEAVWNKKVAFLAVFFVVFFCTYMTLVVLDILPEPPQPKAENEVHLQNDETPAEVAEQAVPVAVDTNTVSLEEVDSSVATPTVPVQISIPSLNLDVTVLNPTSRTIADLDEALLSGAVRHPDSALLGQDGTVFILGHSSYLPVVRNRNFQAFNGIQKLAWGDTIELEGDDGVYVYRVDRVYKAQAQEVVVPIAGDKKRLVLATCNSFGSIDDRHIVEAEFISVRSKT